MQTEIWMAVSPAGVRLLEHEGDYETGDVLVRVGVDITGAVAVSVLPHAE